MSTQWEGLLPSLNAEFLPILLKQRAPSDEEAQRLKALKQKSAENCQVILRGLAAVGVAFVEAHEEMTDAEKGNFGYLAQYLAHLGADLADIEGNASCYLATSGEVVNG